MIQRIHSHLGGLVDDLEECLNLFFPERQPLDEPGYDSEATSDSECSRSINGPRDSIAELDQHLLSLKHTIDNLYKLSFLIRNPKARQRALNKAESYGKNFDGQGGDRFQHLEADHRARSADFIRKLREDSGCSNPHISPSEDAALISQLSEASSKRQRQFAYWELHSRKLSAEGPFSASKQQGTGDTLNLSRLATGPGTIVSGTDATSFHAVDHDAQSVAASASTARGLDGTKVPFPKAPKLEDGQTEFECPYCYVWCPVSERHRWRKHLFEDVRPYMCTYANCSEAIELFATRAEWLAHEKGVHLRVWKCRDHPSIPYESQGDFESHMRSQHISLTDREIDASSKYSMTTVDDTRTHCRMCLVTVPQLLRGQSLANHMAHHYETFARPSFPDHGGVDDDIDSDDDGSDLPGDEDPAVPRDAELDDMPGVTPDDFEDAQNHRDTSSIHALAVNGNKYGMRALLDDQPDLNSKDDEGWTALQRAAYAGQSTILQMLLGAGADVNYSSGYYGNALQCAASQGHEDILRSLIEGGANVNQQGGYHGSALVAAACRGHETVVRILLEAGVIVDAPNDGRMSATEGAMEHGHTGIVLLLDLKTKGQRTQQRSHDIAVAPELPPIGHPGTSPPWQPSQMLGGEYVWNPQTDEIILKTGQRYARPPKVPTSALQTAIYVGPLPPFRHDGSELPSASDFSRMGSQPREPRQVQTIPQGDTQVVFQSATPSQIQRHEPARYPDKNARGVNIGDQRVTQELFPTFKVREDPKSHFRVGRLCLVLWSESAGESSDVARHEPGTVLNHFGERVFSKVRRCVVIPGGDNYSYALPINTYGGRGVAKPGVVKSDHVIIHTGLPAPRPQQNELPGRGEAGMQTVPIRVELDTPNTSLDPMSRLNLAGLTMIKHNIKVQGFGKVSDASVRDLQLQFQNVWGRVSLPTPQEAVGPAGNSGTDDEDGDSEDEDDDGNDGDDDEEGSDGSAKATS